MWWAAAALAGLSMASLALVWTTHQRVRTLEQELVRRQEASQDQSTEARLLARQARDAATEVAAKQALLEARVAETALQRSQVEELIQSLSRSRDENLLSDVDAALRVAQQQAAITGSVEPLLSALRQAEERLARHEQPRVDRVRRAIARDLDRVRAAPSADLPALSLRVDELMRQVDELPLLAGSRPAASTSASTTAATTAPSRPASRPAAARPAASAGSASAVAAADTPSGWWEAGSLWLSEQWGQASTRIGQEARALLRVTPIDHPEAMLIAPDQAYFLRENLKLRLLNARLALLSRQFDLAQADLSASRQMMERYFDRSSRRVGVAIEQLTQIGQQARQAPQPRPDETLAALAAAAAGR